MVDYLDIRIESKYEGEFDEFCVHKDINKHKIQEAQKRLLYDDDEYLQMMYKEILEEEQNDYESQFAQIKKLKEKSEIK